MTRIVSRLAVVLWFPVLACSGAVSSEGSSPISVEVEQVPSGLQGPMYKPSSSSPAPIDISTNAYGAYSDAPQAPQIGDTAANFELPLVGGGVFKLAEARKAGPVLVMFYRGFW